MNFGNDRMRDRVSLNQLRAFHTVMTEGSVTAAAARLNLTQPAISKQLIALERGLEITLFKRRSGSPMSPTRKGIEFFRAIEGTIAGLDELYDTARDIDRRGSRRLRIAATPPLLNSAPLIEAVRRYLTADANHHVTLESRHRLDIEDWIARSQIDFALTLLPNHNPDLHSIPMLHTRAVAVVAGDHPLAHHATLDADTCRGETLILPSRQPLRTRINEAMEAEGASPVSRIECSSAITGCRVAAAGLGVAICDPFSPTAFPGADLKILAWSPEISLEYGALLNNDSELDPQTQTLLDYVRTAFRSFRS